MNEHKHPPAQDQFVQRVPGSKDGTFLRPGEDGQEFLDFRTRQVRALEPKGIQELQLALAIADVGWQIHCYMQTLDRLTHLTDLDEPTRNLNSSKRPLQPKCDGVKRSYGFDRTMVPFSRITRLLELEPTNVKLLETRVAELEDHVECLGASLRTMKAARKSVTYVFGRSKLH